MTSEVVTCCQIKDIKLTSSVNGSLFLMLLYLNVTDDKCKKYIYREIF